MLAHCTQPEYGCSLRWCVRSPKSKKLFAHDILTQLFTGSVSWLGGIRQAYRQEERGHNPLRRPVSRSSCAATALQQGC